MYSHFKLAITILIIFSLTFSGTGFETEREDELIPPESQVQCWNATDTDDDGNTPFEQPSGEFGKGPHDTDPGCVNPYWEDPNEGMIWDTHLTSLMADLESPNNVFEHSNENPDVTKTESIFFSGQVKQGGYPEVESYLDTSNDNVLNMYYIDSKRSEDEVSGTVDGIEKNAYGFGFLNQTEYDIDDFPTWNRAGANQEVELGAANGRVIDTPHDLSEACGNGLEDLEGDNLDEDSISDNPLGDEQGYTSDFIDCRSDYGRILMKYNADGDENSAEHNYGTDSLTCDNDSAWVDAICEGDSDCSCGDSDDESTSCEGEVTTDRSCQEGTNYYGINDDNGDEITRDSCVGSTCDDTNSKCAAFDDCDYTTCYSTGDDCGSCDNQTQYASDNSNTNKCGEGDVRSFTNLNSVISNTDDDFSVVDGGGRTDSDGSVVQGVTDRIDNDPAATFTKFTAYADNTWTDEGNECDDCEGVAGVPADSVHGTGKVWAGYDYTTTVNADGPRGYGNGFLVINQTAGEDENDTDRIIGRESPNGGNQVGKNIHYGFKEAGGSDGSATEKLEYDLIDKVDLSCPGAKTICIRYVDFWTVGPGGDGDPGDPKWRIAPGNIDQPTEEEIRSAVDADSKVFTLDESYSVCKAANRISQKNPEGMAENIDWNDEDDAVDGELVDCDYMREEDGDHRNISPLPEACGDQPNQHLMVMEGSSVNSTISEQWLGHEQKCVTWEGDGDIKEDLNDRSLSESACINQGRAYAEGTVMNVASEVDEGYPHTTEGWETGGDSPDWHVCLDIDDYVNEDAPKPYKYRHNDRNNDYYGGQWYDLDDPRINEYLAEVEDGETEHHFDQDITSNVAGDESQAIDYIDYYYTRNPYPQHPDYNPLGGVRGTSVLADCGSGLNCSDNQDEIRGDVSSVSYGDGTYFAFWDGENDVFDRWSRDEDYHPQGEDGGEVNIQRQFFGYIVRMESQSDQLDESHQDYQTLDLDDEWWYNTNDNSNEAVRHAYAEDSDWGVDSTGAPYPPAGSSEAGDYFTATEAEAGNFRHIDAEPPRFEHDERSIDKTEKAHGNSVLLVASENNEHGYEEGQAYWVDPDDIFREWQNGNIDESYW